MPALPVDVAGRVGWFYGERSAGVGNVSFRWRDSAHGNKKRIMALPVDEFLHRFLLHLLPRGFVRIRNFGFLANRQRATLLPLCFKLLQSPEDRSAPPFPAAQLPRTEPLPRCPLCGGDMHIVERLSPDSAALSLSTPTRPACRMTTQLQPRKVSMLRNAQPICASHTAYCVRAPYCLLLKTPQKTSTSSSSRISRPRGWLFSVKATASTLCKHLCPIQLP
jgi:hypothetical protein